MVDTPDWLRPIINIQYPANNVWEFERWFHANHKHDVSDRHYLGILFCAYHVNNNYGNDGEARTRLQQYVDELDPSQKYFSVSQYDDGVGVDWKGKDVLEFNMSKNGDNMYPLPLIGQPQPYRFTNQKKYFANFVGAMTHPIRAYAETLKGIDGYYIAYGKHDIQEYCRVLSQSMFTLCFRGYGINSFRICEALQYGSIPVYISDEFIVPHNIPFEEYGVVIKAEHATCIDEILNSITPFEIEKKQKRGREVYEQAFTYTGCRNLILQHLINESEHNTRGATATNEEPALGT